jgi:ornithine carbamoyltransferase
MEHFIAIEGLTRKELSDYLSLSRKLKAEWRARGNKPILRNRTLGMVFQKPSLRTRVSFDMAMLHLGGHALYLSPNEIGLGQRESIADVSRVLSRYVDGIMARVFAHDHVVELAKYSSVPVINGLSDWEHPCQTLADLLTIIEHQGKLKGTKVVFVGDGNNVARSLMFGCALGGANFVCASPHGYWLDQASVTKAGRFAEEAGGSVALTESAKQAVDDANVIYADVWASMGQEDEAVERSKIFAPYQVNSALVSLAKSKAIVMHCLPAHRGAEITDDVMDGPHSVVFDQAENRMHAQKAILAKLMASQEEKSESHK